jgi:predicted nucleic acid-binding Zn ribbon protein
MERAGKSVARLLEKPGVPAEDIAKAAWPAAVGRRIAQYARPAALVRDKLIVEVDDAIWQRQLWQMRAPILAKLCALLGANLVHDLEFRIAIPRRPAAAAPSPAHSTAVRRSVS